MLHFILFFAFGTSRSDVRLGEWDVRMDNEEAKDVSIAKILTSKDYDPKLLVNDIAILLLGQTVEFNGKGQILLHFPPENR